MGTRGGVLGPPPPARRVAVVRALPGLGDLLCAVPALRALRTALPTAEITLVGLSGAHWFVERFGHYVDDLLVCPTWPGLPEIDGPARAAMPFLSAARRRRFDLAIQMHGDGHVTNGLTAALGAARWVGLSLDAPGPIGADGRIGPYRLDRHEVERCMDVLVLAGVAPGDLLLELPTTPAERAVATRLVGSRRSFAVVHPGSSTPARRWSPLGFGRVVEHLLARVDRVLLTGGRSEADVTAAVAATLPDSRRVVDLAGRTGLGELAALASRAGVVVANDTGVAHLGAAVGAPTVTVCGPSDRHRWAPLAPDALAVGGDPPGRWPTVHEVRLAVDTVLDTGERDRL